MLRKTKNNFKQNVYHLNPPWESADFYFKACGIFKSSGDFLWDQPGSSYAIHIITSGKGCFEVDGKSYSVGKDKIFTFFPGQYIRYYDSPETPWEYTWFYSEGKKVKEVLAESGITRSNPLIDIADNMKFKSILSQIVRDCVKSTKGNLFSIASAWNLFSALSVKTKISKLPTTRKLFEECVIFIESHPNNNITVDELSDRFEVNRTTLFRAFKLFGNLSPKEYIDQRRFEKAKQLLKNSNMPISQIAQACGFSKHHYFSNAFRKRFKITPGEYRI
jgi:AraC-like DNA-binding protein